MTSPINLRDWIPSAAETLFSALIDMAPWDVTSRAETIVRNSLHLVSGYDMRDGVAIHRLATVEAGAVIKSPAVIGPNCLVAAGAYLRGGVFLDEGCMIGPNCEVKSTFMLMGAKIAHLSFIGDSIIGGRANIEAGAVIANYRNERHDKRIRIQFEETVIDTGVEKFGALVGDGARIGAGAVIAPGALIRPGAVIARLALVDQSPPI